MLGLCGLLLIFLFIWEKGSISFHMTWSHGVLIIVFSCYLKDLEYKSRTTYVLYTLLTDFLIHYTQITGY